MLTTIMSLDILFPAKCVPVAICSRMMASVLSPTRPVATCLNLGNNYDFEAMDLNGDGYLSLTTINDGLGKRETLVP